MLIDKMKEKIATALKTKYQRFGLSNEAIDRIASAKEKTVTSEDAIEAGIADTETMGLIASELMKMRDKEIQQRTDTQRAFDTYKEKHPESNPAPEPTAKPADEPEWAKRLREQQEAIAARFAREDEEKALKAARLTVESKLKSLISPEIFNAGVFNSTLKGFSPLEGESLDDAANRLKAEYDSIHKETFGNGPRPIISTQAYGDPKAAVTHKNDFLREQGLLPTQEK